jgi:hypothetical protein
VVDRPARYQLRFPVEYQAVSSQQVGKGRTINISSSGLLLRVAEPIALGEQLIIHCQFIDPKAACGNLVCTCIVVRSTQQADESLVAAKITTYDISPLRRASAGNA